MHPQSLVTRGLQAAFLAGAVLAAPAHAAFIDRGNGVVYDTASGLDWELRPGSTWTDWADANAHRPAARAAGRSQRGTAFSGT